MVCCLGILFVGCSGPDSKFNEEMLEKWQNNLITDEEFEQFMQESLQVPMYGTKVLYRPEHYDFDQGGGEYANYFAKYSYIILRDLIDSYGQGYGQGLSNQIENYQFDSIRYNVYQFDNITQIETIATDGKSTTDEYEGYNVYANTSKTWNMTIETNNENIMPVGLIYASYIDSYEWNGKNKEYFSEIAFDNHASTYYNSLYGNNNYAKAFLAPQAASLPSSGETQNVELAKLIESRLYSDVVKAMEYALYCFSLDLQPKAVTFSKGTTKETPIIVTIDGQSADSALQYIKEIFNRVGTTVGISEKNQTKLKNWILETLIGESTMENDTVTYNSSVTKVVTQKSDGTETISYEVNTDNTSTVISNARAYEETIDNIVTTACEQVSIGNVSDDDVNVDERFLASEVKDFWGNNFFISSESESGHEFDNIPAMEYQSAVLMFSEEQNISNLWVAFKYDAGDDGDDIVDPNASITIKVHLNHYRNGVWTEVGTDTITVPDGAFDYMGATNPSGTTQMARFEGLGPKNSEEGLRVGAFNVDVGNGILRAMDKYNGQTPISDPIVLIGSTQVKDYYKLIEPEETLEDGTTYTYGILNSEKFAGNDGCDYLEIAYEVVKVAGDVNTNYKFYTGITLVG